jgi:hypothetical protein
MRFLRIALALLNLLLGCFFAFNAVLIVWLLAIEILPDPRASDDFWPNVAVAVTFLWMLATIAGNVVLLATRRPHGSWAHVGNMVSVLVILANLAFYIPEMEYFEGGQIGVALQLALIAVFGLSYWTIRRRTSVEAARPS